MFRERIVGLADWGKNGADYDQEVDGLKAVDDYTIELILSAPFAPMLDLLATTGAAIVPREAVDAPGAGLGQKPVGSGPYVLTELTSAGA